jgi:sensor histidine kinase YesM
MLFIEKKFDGIVSSKTGDSINDAKLLKLSVNKDMKGIGLSNIKESLTATIGRHNK